MRLLNAAKRSEERLRPCPVRTNRTKKLKTSLTGVGALEGVEASALIRLVFV